MIRIWIYTIITVSIVLFQVQTSHTAGAKKFMFNNRMNVCSAYMPLFKQISNLFNIFAE